MSEDTLPESTVEPVEEADQSSHTIKGLGAKDPKERKKAVEVMHEKMLGEAVLDPAKDFVRETNKAEKLDRRVNMKNVSGTVTYGKGMPHVN